MTFRHFALALLGVLALALSSASAQEAGPAASPPTVEQMLQDWRTAMDPRSSAPAYAIHRSTERGLATTTETWATPDGASYRRRVTRERDGEEWLLTPERAEMRDWNGFVRRIDGTELVRLRAEAQHAALLAFGPQGALEGEVVGNTFDEHTAWALRTPTPDGVTEWIFDNHGTPRVAIRTDSYGDRTVYEYRWWGVGNFAAPRQPNRRAPTVVRVGEGEEVLEYSQGDGWFPRRARDVFDPLEPGPRDVVMYGNAVRIPFTMEANHIILQVRVNGHAPIGFLVDTGAAVSNVNSARMAAFGLEGYGGGSVQGGGGSVSNSFVDNVTFSFGGVQLRRQHVKAFDLSGLERAWGVPIGGTFGFDFFSRFVVEIDYQNNVMTLHRPQAWRYRGTGMVTPVTFDGGIPYAEAVLSVPTRPDLPARLLMDNGLADTMVFTRPYVEANDLARLAGGNTTVNATAGLENQFFAQRNTRGRIERLRVGELVLEGVPVNFSTNTSGAYASNFFAATFGNAVFNRYHVFVDYPGRRFIFEPTPAAAAPFADRRTFGLTVLAGGEDLRTFTVSGLRAGSPAAAAGFLQNDVIAGVDDREAAAFTLQQLRDLLLREGEHHVFRVRRGEAALTIETYVTLVSIER